MRSLHHSRAFGDAPDQIRFYDQLAFGMPRNVSAQLRYSL